MTDQRQCEPDQEMGILQVKEVREHLEQLRRQHARARGLPLPPEPDKLRKPKHKPKPRRAKKISTTLRLSQEVLHRFKSSGNGWQTRINEALQKLVTSGQV